VLTLIIFMGVILTVAVIITVYVAFPHRGEDLPAAPWLGDVMRKGVDALPVLEEHEHAN
jgi:hypothetical protein